MLNREYEVVRTLAAHAAVLFPVAGKRVIQAERGYGRGVADLVLLDIDQGNLLERRSRGLPPARRAGEAAVLEAVVMHSGEDVDGILSSVAMTRSHARRLLSELTLAGLISITDGRASPCWPAHPIVSRVIAIEAKLSDWRSGVVQAMRYQAFADETYLALPTSRIEAFVREPDRLQGLGLGLIGVSADRCFIAQEAERLPPREPALRRWLEEAEYGDLTGDTRRLIAPFPARFEQPSPAELVSVA